MQQIAVTVLVLALAASSSCNVISFANGPSGPKQAPPNGTSGAKPPGHPFDDHVQQFFKNMTNGSSFNFTVFDNFDFNNMNISGFHQPHPMGPPGGFGGFGGFEGHGGPGGFGGFGGHGGPGGFEGFGRHGGPKKNCPSAVARKVGECHRKYSKGPVNVLMNIDPKIMDRMDQLMNDWEADDQEEDEKVNVIKTMIKTFLNGPLGANIKKMMNVKMAFHAGMFVDKICADLQAEKCNAAFGYGNTWYWISGSENSRANKTALHEMIQKSINMSAFSSMMNMSAFPPMMNGGFGGPNGPQGHMGGMGGFGGFGPHGGMAGPDKSGESNSDESNSHEGGAFGPRGKSNNDSREDDHFGGKPHGNFTFANGRPGHMMGPKTNISKNIAWALVHQALGKAIPFEANKVPKTAESSGFQIMVTMDNFDRNKFKDIDAIIDLFGRYSNDTNNAGYATENVYIASTPDKAMDFIETIRFRICQRNGGVAKTQPPRPQHDQTEPISNARAYEAAKSTPKIQPSTMIHTSPKPSSKKPAVTMALKPSTTRKAPIPLAGKTTTKKGQGQNSS